MDYTIVPSRDIIDKTAKAVMARNIKVHVVGTREEALETVTNLIPNGSEVMTGSSTTLEEIGFVDLLKLGKHPWKNLKAAIVAEKDPIKQAELRRQSVLSKYFLGSVHAITEDGQLVIASASGSQIPSYSYTSDTVIWVAGSQKIVPDFAAALKRIEDYVIPLEDARMKATGAPGTVWSYMLVVKKSIMPNRTLHLVFVQEKLGF